MFLSTVFIISTILTACINPCSRFVSTVLEVVFYLYLAKVPALTFSRLSTEIVLEFEIRNTKQAAPRPGLPKNNSEFHVGLVL